MSKLEVSILSIVICIGALYFFNKKSEFEVSCQFDGGTYIAEDQCARVTKAECDEHGAHWDVSNDLCFDGDQILLEVGKFNMPTPDWLK